MNVKVIYGSDAGCTRAVASRIAKKINATALNITKASSEDMESADLLILGCPTYGLGDLQCDWEDRLNVLESADLSRSKVAIFGTGDQISYPDSFVDAIGILYDIVVNKGATVVGFTDPKGYDFSNSAALRDGQFVGLALDEDNQSSKTEGRITEWIAQLM